MSRKRLCASCIDEEMARSSACYAREKEARARGEIYMCTCPPLDCPHDGTAPPIRGTATDTATEGNDAK